VLRGERIQRQGGSANLLGYGPTYKGHHALVIDVLVVSAEICFGRGCEDRFRQTLRLLHSFRQLDAAHSSGLPIIAPP
jgi:hypothetical protein